MPSNLPDPVPPAARATPWAQLKYFTYHPSVYPRMLGAVSPDAKPGDLVGVYDKDNRPFGVGFYNPGARVPLRVLHHGPAAPDEALLETALDRACELRERLPELADRAATDAWRVVHSDGDALSGLVVDRYADVLCVEVHSLGAHRRLGRWLPRLHARLGTTRATVRVDPAIARMEGIVVSPDDADAPTTVKIREHGVRYEVDFAAGHKTGFFCDQRENRRRFGEWVRRLGPGTRVADLCCYTGGFALAARITGGAEDITGVDLDEAAVAQARRNANLNQARVNWVHADAFSWARQMLQNGEKWDALVLDPPKLVFTRDDVSDGRQKYQDLNGLAMQLARPGALFVTCSCSGLVSEEEFEQLVIRAAHRHGRRLQFLDRTGAGPDHPVLSNCLESRYLKVFWARVW
jgi:23S rRNA (cytosine1962-C5)-methyltransferase